MDYEEDEEEDEESMLKEAKIPYYGGMGEDRIVQFYKRMLGDIREVIQKERSHIQQKKRTLHY